MVAVVVAPELEATGAGVGVAAGDERGVAGGVGAGGVATTAGLGVLSAGTEGVAVAFPSSMTASSAPTATV